MKFVDKIKKMDRKKAIFIGAGILLVILILVLFFACGKKTETVSLKNTKITGALANYMELNGEDGELELKLSEGIEPRTDGTGGFMAYNEVITFTVPVKITKAIPNPKDLGNIVAVLKSDGKQWAFDTPQDYTVACAFTKEEIDEYNKLVNGSAGTEGKLILRFNAAPTVKHTTEKQANDFRNSNLATAQEAAKTIHEAIKNGGTIEISLNGFAEQQVGERQQPQQPQQPQQ